MTETEAKLILKTHPHTVEEIALYKEALKLVSTSWVKVPIIEEEDEG